jgi:hypothetical protein
MKLAQLVALAIVIFALMNWSRGEYAFGLPMTLPLLGGMTPSKYDLAGALIIGIAIAGLMRLIRNRRHDSRDT